MGERAEKAGYLTAKLSFIFMLAAGIILALTPGPIMGIFTADEEIIRIGAAFLRYFTLAAVFMGPAGSLSSILNGAGDNMPAMMGALISIWFVQIPLLYVSIQLLQLSVEWVWISYIVAYAVHYYVILRYVKGGKWKDKCVI